MSWDFDERDRASVVRDLQSPDYEVRRLAVERVSAIPVDEGLPLLVERLGDADWRVRKAAIERLIACPEVEAVARELIGALADGENPGRRNAAVEALVHCGSRVVPALVEATFTLDSDVRKLVIDALAGIGDAQARDRLVVLLVDSDANVRSAAADALGAIGGDAAEASLLALAVRDGEEPQVRLSALRAMGALGAPVPARELGPVLEDPILRPAALDLIGREEDEGAVAVLLKGLVTRSQSTRESAMRSLLRLLSQLDGSRAEQLVAQVRAAAASEASLVSGVIERLEDTDLPMKLVIVQFLGLLGVREALVPILVAGRDEALFQVCQATLLRLGDVAESAIDSEWPRLESASRRDACLLFGHTAGELSAARLIASLDDTDPAIRTAAARSIGKRRLGAALSLLVNRLERAAGDEALDSEDEVLGLTEALIAVAKPRPDGPEAPTRQAVELLCEALDGAVEIARLAIAKVLGCIGAREDAPLVAFLLKDPSPLVRRAAVEGLARLDPGATSEPLRLALADETAMVRIAAAFAIGASACDEALDDLARLADDADARVRAAAVRSAGLRMLRSEDGSRHAEILERIGRGLDDDPLVALAAVETLREIGGSEAARVIDVLERPEPELVMGAVACLGAHGDEEALEALFPLVSHRDWSVRAEAIQALADRRVTRAVPHVLRRLETEQDDFVRDVILRALEKLES